jgi:hypothetical protein
MYSQITEGGVLAAGIALAAIANTNADCDMTAMPGQAASQCHGGQEAVSDLSLALIIGGLVGFIATISTAVDDDKPNAPAVDIKASPAAGSAAPAPEITSPVPLTPVAPAPAPLTPVPPAPAPAPTAP